MSREIGISWSKMTWVYDIDCIAPPETIEIIVRHTTKALFKEPE